VRWGRRCKYRSLCFWEDSGKDIERMVDELEVQGLLKLIPKAISSQFDLIPSTCAVLVRLPMLDSLLVSAPFIRV
jgi:hypothetical protein